MKTQVAFRLQVGDRGLNKLNLSFLCEPAEVDAGLSGVVNPAINAGTIPEYRALPWLLTNVIGRLGRRAVASPNVAQQGMAVATTGQD